jgi:GT2 family glycosyltransferase
MLPTFARVEETKSFLQSIKESITDEYLILIIDDHPDKVTYEKIEKNSNLRILKPEEELWWVGSINLGIKVLFDEYSLSPNDMIIFANNDMTIDKKSFYMLSQELIQNPNQIIHPRTFNHNNVEVSSGAKILSLFPYITNHPKNFSIKKIEVDMGTARFLCLTFSVLKKVGYINHELVQYLGDNDFTLRAKRQYGIKTYILRDAVCVLDDRHTGLKNTNIMTLKELVNSFFSLRSPNNIKYRFRFFKIHYNAWTSFFVTISMTLNAIVKFIIKKIL